MTKEIPVVFQCISFTCHNHKLHVTSRAHDFCQRRPAPRLRTHASETINAKQTRTSVTAAKAIPSKTPSQTKALKQGEEAAIPNARIISENLPQWPAREGEYQWCLRWRDAGSCWLDASAFGEELKRVKKCADHNCVAVAVLLVISSR